LIIKIINIFTKLKFTNFWFFGMAMLIAGLAVSCSEEKDNGTLAAVKTNDVTNIKITTAKSGLTVTNIGTGKILAAGVCWATHANPTVEDFTQAVGKYTQEGIILKNDTSFQVAIAGLKGATDYYLCSYLVNEAGVAYGDIKPFRTKEPAHVLTPDMIETYTQETEEGPKENLVDGKLNTYWHSNWSTGDVPLPHHVQINFPAEVEIGGFSYWFRNPSGKTDRPTSFDFQTSTDGVTWVTKWTSAANLAYEPVDGEREMSLGANFKAKFFRIRILTTVGNRNWTHLAEISVYRVQY